MRNLRRVLSLALAAVMLMGMMIVGAGAAGKDFTDSSEIKNVEAVDVMAALGVLEGGDNGAFQPKSILTREQAAKIICYMLLGKESAEKLTTNYPIFSDVPANRWSAPFISYCVNLGILAGDGAGHFYPEGKLTGVAFAKMLMVCLGYSAEREDYVGNSWEINTSAAAIAAGVAPKGLVLSEELSRQDAAQMAFNTLTATMVEYLNDNTVIIGNTTVSTVGKASAVKQTPYADTMGSEYLQFAEKYFGKLKKLADADDFDRPAHTWSFRGEEIGTYVDWHNMVGQYTTAVSGKDLYNLLTASTIKKYSLAYYVDGKLVPEVVKSSNMIRTNTTHYDTTGNGVLTQVFVDDSREEIVITSINTFLAKATADYNAKKETLSIKVYQDDRYNINSTLSLNDFAISKYKDGDMLTVSVAETSKDKYEVKLLGEPKTMNDSTVTKFSKESYLVTGGTQYDYAHKGTVLNELADYYGSLLDNTYDVYTDDYGYVLGTVKVSGALKYLFLTGYDKSASHLSVKTSTGAAIFLDGTFQEIQIAVNDTNTNIAAYQAANKGIQGANGDQFYRVLANGDNQYNKWFTYTTDKNGVYTLTPVSNWMDIKAPADPAGAGEVTKINPASVRLNSSTVQGNVLGVGAGISKYAYGNDASVYITVKTGAVSDNHGSADMTGITKVNNTYTGVQSVDLVLDKDNMNGLSNIDNTTANTNNSPAIFAVYNKDLYIIGAVVVGQDENNTKNYAYALKSAQNEYVDKDGNYYWDFQAVVDGKIQTLTVKEKGTRVLRDRINNWIGLDTWSLIQVTYDKNGFVVDAVQCVDNVTDAATQTIDKVYSNTEFLASKDRGDYKVYDVALDGKKNESLISNGNTLYVENYTTKDIGLTITAGAPVVLVQKDTAGRWVINEYANIKQALDALEDANAALPGVQFKGHVAAVLNNNTTAQYLVIKSETLVPVNTDDGSKPATDLSKVTVAWDGFNPNAMWLNLLDKNGDKLTSGTYTYTLYYRSNSQGAFGVAETGTVNAASVKDAAFKANLSNGSSWYVVVDGMTSNVITQGV